MTSSAFPRCLVGLYELLAGASFPGVQPQVGLSEFTANEHGTVTPAEYVLVLTSAPMDSQQVWASMRKDRTEEFTITVDCGTTVPGRTVRQALERIEELTATVETALRDVADPSEGNLLADFKGSWEVISVEPWIGPRAEGDGFDASCALSIRVRARI
jgi:hypothetical protein